MYAPLLVFHSLFRWLILASLLFAIFRAFRGWLTNESFSKLDNTLRHITATLLHIQLVLGIVLYFTSPLIDYFLHNFSAAVKERAVRFFGMEHNGMMFIAIVLVTIGSSLAKRKETDKAKFKTMAIYFTIGLLLILIAIPWPFSPMAARPYFRLF